MGHHFIFLNGNFIIDHNRIIVGIGNLDGRDGYIAIHLAIVYRYMNVPCVGIWVLADVPKLNLVDGFFVISFCCCSANAYDSRISFVGDFCA